MLEHYLHKQSDDRRTQNQITLTRKLTSALTQLNQKRIKCYPRQRFPTNKSRDINSQSQMRPCDPNEQKVIFVCISGIPPFQNQFGNMCLRGKVLTVVLPGFQSDMDQQSLRKRSSECNLDDLSREIDMKIQQFPADFSLVFMYHSFGTFIASYYFKNFHQKQQHRIKGIIQIGGGPIRVYPLIESGLQASQQMSRQFIQQNIDFIFSAFNQKLNQWKKNDVLITPYKSKYNMLGLFSSYKSQRFNEVFDFNRKIPRVLKLFIYGSKDTVFQTKNLDQKAIFYAYNSEARLDQQYIRQLKLKYQGVHKQIPQNLQQRFIYKIQNGKHSLHMQKQFQHLIQMIIDDYLDVVL